MVDWGIDTGEIFSEETVTDDQGKTWHVINKDTQYPADRFTMESARVDYQSADSKMARFNAMYSMWCD
jgi:hypothetical protein